MIIKSGVCVKNMKKCIVGLWILVCISMLIGCTPNSTPSTDKSSKYTTTSSDYSVTSSDYKKG